MNKATKGTPQYEVWLEKFQQQISEVGGPYTPTSHDFKDPLELARSYAKRGRHWSDIENKIYNKFSGVTQEQIENIRRECGYEEPLRPPNRQLIARVDQSEIPVSHQD